MTAGPGARAVMQARLARILLAALLTALVLAGLRGHIRLHGQAAPDRGDGIAVGAILEAVLAAALAALFIRERRAPPGAVLAARLRQVLRPLVIAGLIANPVVLLLVAPLRTHPRPLRLPPSQPPPLVPSPTPAGRPAAHGSAAIHVPLPAVLYSVLVIALIAAALACAIALRRRQAAVSYPEPVPDADAQRTGLQAAVESGRSALRALDDARAAIIACYLSMEQSLAGAGAIRGPADTPDEFLARAAGAGLIRGAAAARLTGLFYEARFSSHHLGADQRNGAREALRDLADDLAHPPAPPSRAPQSPAPPSPDQAGGRA